MGETFTTNFYAVTNKAQMKEADVQENMEADEVIFYHSIRADLDLLKKKPKLQTIHHILDYSRSVR